MANPREKAAVTAQFMIAHLATPEVARDFCRPDVLVHFTRGEEWHGVEALVENLTPKA